MKQTNTLTGPLGIVQSSRQRLCQLFMSGMLIIVAALLPGGRAWAQRSTLPDNPHADSVAARFSICQSGPIQV